MKKVLIIDTSILCVYLEVPGKDTCGSDKDRWNKQRVDDLLKKEIEKSTIFVLPLAAIIETGNHIAQAAKKRYEIAQALAEIILKTAKKETPWAAFTEQSVLWDTQGLKNLAEEWPELAKQKLSIGDATIISVANYYAKTGVEVEILTGDAGLKLYESITPIPTPRRRRN
jgi:hypothetical protein